MSVSIPFEEETFRPLCVPNNDKADHPVTFEICAVGGASRARIKSMIIATGGLAQTGDWSREVQEAVIASFESGAGAFSEGVKKITGLTAPAALALRAGIITKIPEGMDRKTEIPITTGYEFARVCGFWPLLSFEVAMAIARVSGQSEVDPRFFAWLSTSLGMPEIPLGTVAPVERKRGKRATAGSKTSTETSGRTTSRRTRSSSPGAPAATASR